MTDEKKSKEAESLRRRQGSVEQGSKQINEHRHFSLDNLREKLASKPKPSNNTNKS